MASTSTITAHYDIKKAVEHLYDVSIFNKTILTTVTKHPSAVTDWITSVCSDGDVRRYIGFQFELIPGVHDIIGTVQFCVGSRCLIIQLLRMPHYPPSLDQFLSNSYHTFVAVNAEWKINRFTDQCPFIEGPVSYRELREPAAQFHFRPELVDATQGELFKATFGVELEKPHAETDWGRKDMLSEAQVHYACIEAFECYELGNRLVNKSVFRFTNIE